MRKITIPREKSSRTPIVDPLLMPPSVLHGHTQRNQLKRYSQKTGAVLAVVTVTKHISASRQCHAHHLHALPVGVRVVVHKPGAVVVHVHSPGLVVLPQHHILQDVGPSDPKGRVRVVVIAINGHFPVMNAAGESGITQDHPVIVAVARHRQIVVGEDDVRVSGGRVEGEPSNCARTWEQLHTLISIINTSDCKT